MLLRSLVCFLRAVGGGGGAGGSPLNESVVTRQLTTKNVRRPKAAGALLRREQERKRRVSRGRDLYAKEAHMKSSMEQVSNARDVIMVQLADQIFSKGHTHTATATNVSFVPDGNPATPLVALAGRGKVGKTSLLRSLFRSPTQVGKSNRVLRRDAMNYFNVGDVFNVVDLPGFGGTAVPWSTVLQHAVLLRNFARFQPSLKMLYYCMDVHHKNGVFVQDIDMLKFLAQEVPNFTVVITKGDQINESDRSPNTFRTEDILRELVFHDIHHPVLVTSAYRMSGIDTLRYDMVMNAVHALPTERLTFTEAKKLSARLFSQKELSTVRDLAIAPTQLDDDIREWKAALVEGLTAGVDSATTAGLLADGAVSRDEAEDASGASPSGSPPEDEFVISKEEVDRVLREAGESGAEEPQPSPNALACSPTSPSSSHVPVVFPDEPDKQAAYVSLTKKARNKGLLSFLQQTSPWRNPLIWPHHIIPTKHPKSNLMRCPEDPHNPYLTQAHFVTPRADMCFRRPNVGIRKSSQKGVYEPDKPLQYLLRPYTIPYFPDITDTGMHPQPWTFVGSREAFFEKSGGRRLGVRLSMHARQGEVNPLSGNPAPGNPLLTEEVRKLEKKRYGTPIAMLRPPEPHAENNERST